MLYPNNNRSVTVYDSENRITKHENYFGEHRINVFDYTDAGSLDNEGNKLKEKTNLGVKAYGYDNIYQLTSAVYERNQSFTWAHDAAGNRSYSRDSALRSHSLGIIAALSEKSYAKNGLNQYTAVSGISFTYDDNGNMTSRGSDSFGWDYNNRLVSAVVGGSNSTYKYNNSSLRVSRLKGGSVTKYYYNGTKLLAEGDGK